MDAVEFLKTKSRLCHAYVKDSCCGCPLRRAENYCALWCFVNPEEAVGIVERWAEQYPVKTRQSEFLKQYPEAGIDDYGVLRVCPSLISTSHRNTRGGCAHIDSDCTDCRREFWMQEVE